MNSYLQKHLATIVAVSQDAIISCDRDRRITSWNRGAERMYGYSAAEALGARVEAVIRPADAREAEAQKRNLTELIEGGRDTSEPRQMARLRKDGSLVWTSVMFTCLRGPDGTVEALSGISRDVTESLRQTAELHHANEQLRALTNKMQQVREEERTLLARRVHDDLGQTMTALSLILGLVRRDGTPQGELLDEADELLDQAVQTLQQIAVELRPSALDAVGLRAAVRDEAERFRRRSGLEVEVDIKTQTEPEPRVATELFRVLQELLTNVARHAQASSVRIQLEERSLRVEDDGVGLPPDAEHRQTSLGLLGIRERAASIGATVQLACGPRGGTVAVITTPL